MSEYRLATSLLLLPILAIAASGLGCAKGNILREIDLNNGHSYTTGARQRAITNTEPGALSYPGRVDPKRIVCSEPSPDVAVAVASSMSGEFKANSGRSFG